MALLWCRAEASSLPPTHELRSPYRLRALVAPSSDAALSGTSGASLRRMLAATQFVVLAWSIARVAFDGWHRLHDVETDLALAIAGTMTLALATKGLRWCARRRPHGMRRPRPPSLANL